MFFWNLWWGFRDLTYKIICHILQSCPSTITEQGARQKPPPTQREEMIESLARGTLWPWFSFGMTFAPSTLGRDELAIALGSVPPKDKAMTAWISFIFCKYSDSPFVYVSPALVGNVCGFNEQNYILNIRLCCPESPLLRAFGWVQRWQKE